jgi:hypothetical protein
VETVKAAMDVPAAEQEVRQAFKRSDVTREMAKNNEFLTTGVAGSSGMLDKLLNRKHALPTKP